MKNIQFTLNPEGEVTVTITGTSWYYTKELRHELVTLDFEQFLTLVGDVLEQYDEATGNRIYIVDAGKDDEE